VSDVTRNVRLWHKADMPVTLNDGRFWGQTGHHFFRASCLLLTQSGNWVLRIVASQNDVESPLCRDQVVGRCPVDLCNGHADAPSRNGIEGLEARLRSQDVFPTVG
jgi:hypothetical protein